MRLVGHWPKIRIPGSKTFMRLPLRSPLSPPAAPPIPAGRRNVPGPGHVERPARLHAVLQALDHDRYAALDRVEAPPATREQLLRVHDAGHIGEVLLGAPAGEMLALDQDTVMGPGSTEAALHAAGAVVAAVDAVLGGSAQRAFCAVRPPGHHATRERAMGFCLFDNVAVGAAHALATHGLKRVAIADFEVPHGNGPKDILRPAPTLPVPPNQPLPA